MAIENTIFDLRLPIVKSVFGCLLPGVLIDCRKSEPFDQPKNGDGTFLISP